jgi:molybdopterin synthase catalytic subunit
MSVTVRCYAAAAERLGPKVQLDVGTPSTAGQVRAALVAAHPDAAELIGQCRLAVDLDIAAGDTPVEPDSEVALLPPFAGGAGSGAAERAGDAAVVIDVRPPPLGVEEALTAIAHPAAGAQAVFLGRVRDHSSGDPAVHRLDYSAYEPMARQVMTTIADETRARWPSLCGIALLHAVGELAVGAHSVLVACSSPHRAEAYQANQHALEQLKARVPVWKREVGSRGSRWVNLQAPTG